MLEYNLFINGRQGGGRMLCFECLKEIGKERICPYCGAEIFPTVEEANRILKRNIAKTKKKRRSKGLDDEEVLSLGLYPKDEGYKMSLISRILGKK